MHVSSPNLRGNLSPGMSCGFQFKLFSRNGRLIKAMMIKSFSKFGIIIPTIVTMAAYTGSASSIYSDTIFLRSGKKVQGRIINQSRQSVTIDTLNGKRKISKETIQRIGYEHYDLEGERQKIEEEKARLAQEEEKKRLEQQAREDERRVRQEQIRRLNGLKRHLSGEEHIWTRMHMEFRNTKDNVESDTKMEAAMLEDDPAALVGGNSGGIFATVWRSSLIPGWGQWHRDRGWQGGTFLGGTLLGAAAYGASYSSFHSFRSKFTSSSNTGMLLTLKTTEMPLVYLNYQQTLSAHSRMDSAAKSANGAAAFLAVLYIYNLFDAYAFSSSFPGGTGSEELAGNSSTVSFYVSSASGEQKEASGNIAYTVVF